MEANSSCSGRPTQWVVPATGPTARSLSGVPVSDDGPCVVCATPGRACMGCYSVYYCGKDHQLTHWQQGHKHACSPFKISKDPLLGRYLEASRDIPGGTFITRSKPLVYGPQMSAEPVCLGCCRQLDRDPEEWITCAQCGWPLCGEGCQKSPHHLPECTAMAEVDFRMGRDCSSVTVMDGLERINQWSWYGAIVPIRALLLPKKEYKQLMSLQTHLDEHQRNPEFRFKLRSVTNFIHNTLKLHQFQEEDIATVLAIFDTNAFEVCRGELNLMGRVLYYNASMMAHSCQPNARLCYVGEGFDMLLMAEKNIASGASINISYLDRLQGTLKRLSHLRTTKYFDCACSRCSDPTDLGLFLDSLRCIKCRDAGIEALLVSTAPLKLMAEWQCQSCQNRVSATDMIKLHKNLHAAKMTLEKSTQLSDCVEFLKKHLGNRGLLHATSSYVLQIKIHMLFNILGHSKGFFFQEMSDEQLRLKLSLCEEMINVANKLHPGYTKTRGYLLLELHDSLVEKAYRNEKAKQGTKEDIQIIMEKAKVALQEAVSILREPARKSEVQSKVRKFQHKCEKMGYGNFYQLC